MSPSERRMALLDVLRQRRYDTYDNLAFEFGVSRRTICRDIGILMCSYPIETSRGYGGGVRMIECTSQNRNTLSKEQYSCLVELKDVATESQKKILETIITKFVL